MKSNAPAADPKHLAEVILFNGHFPRTNNSLFVEEKSGRLFLAETDQYPTRIIRGAEALPMEAALPTDFHETTLHKALQWYVRFEAMEIESSGTPAILCKMAAKRLVTETSAGPEVAPELRALLEGDSEMPPMKLSEIKSLYRQWTGMTRHLGRLIAAGS